MIEDPPFEVGAAQAITDCFEAPKLAVTDVGAPGTPAVVALAEEEATEVPTPFVATTVKV